MSRNRRIAGSTRTGKLLVPEQRLAASIVNRQEDTSLVTRTVAVRHDREAFEIPATRTSRRPPIGDEFRELPFTTDNGGCQVGHFDSVVIRAVKDVEPSITTIKRQFATLAEVGLIRPNERESAVRPVEVKCIDAPAVLVGNEHESAHAVLADVGVAVLINEPRCAEKRIRNEAKPLRPGPTAQWQEWRRVPIVRNYGSPVDGDVAFLDPLFAFDHQIDDRFVVICLGDCFEVAKVRPFAPKCDLGVNLKAAVAILTKRPKLGPVGPTVAANPESPGHGVPEGATHVHVEVVCPGPLD